MNDFVDRTTTRHTISVRGVAALDSARAPGQDALVGEIDDEVVAVITMRDGIVVADPFRGTAAVVDLLRRRRATLLAAAAGGGVAAQPVAV